MRLRGLRVRIPLRSHSTSVSYQSPSSASPLDLDFVLSLLDSSKGKGLSSTTALSQSKNKLDETIDLGQWSQMKFRVIEGKIKTKSESDRERERDRDRDKDREIYTEKEIYTEIEKGCNTIDNSINNCNSIKPSDFKSFFSPSSPYVNESEIESTLSRLQNLADSLPTQIYDRHGNLILLNSSKSSISFFDLLDTVPTSIPSSITKASSLASNLNAQSARSSLHSLPIFQRENADWKSVTLTSILKKIAPEEVFSDVKVKDDQVDNKILEGTEANSSASASANVDDGLIMKPSVKDKLFKWKKPTSSSLFTSSIIFNNVELRLLDVDQLHLLAKNFKIPIDQTDCRIECEILKIFTTSPNFNLESEKIKNNTTNTFKTKKLPKISKEKVPWTEENETFLVNLYDELRTKKYQVDQKFSSFINQSQGLISSTQIKTNTATINHHHPATPIKRGIGTSSRGLWAVLTDKFKTNSRFHVSVTECRNKLIILKRLRS